MVFQSTLPSQGATSHLQILHDLNRFQSTLPSQGATSRSSLSGTASCISIHAPLTGSDQSRYLCRLRSLYFNPRSPHRERHCTSLLPRRKAHFNPRSPHRERPSSRPFQVLCTVFQSTLPSQGATKEEEDELIVKFNFNPRSPHRERHSRTT